MKLGLPRWMQQKPRANERAPATSSLTLPAFAIVGQRPVKAERTEDGGMRILAYEWETGEFVGTSDYLPHLFFPGALEDDAGGDIDYVSEREFEKRVGALRAQLP
jgi:hypothetical protein